MLSITCTTREKRAQEKHSYNPANEMVSNVVCIFYLSVLLSM